MNIRYPIYEGVYRILTDQWRIAQIFLYRACGLGLRLQNKEYLCAILGAALYCTYFLCTVKLIY